MPVKPRKAYTPTEYELLAEYLAKRHNTISYHQRVRLGDVEEARKAVFGTEKARRIFTPTLQWVDGIAWTKEGITLIEAKDWAKVANPLYQLLTYKALFVVTPKYAKDWNKPIRLELVAGLYSPHIPKMATELGVKCVVYRPIWLLTRLKEKYNIEGYRAITEPEDVN